MAPEPAGAVRGAGEFAAAARGYWLSVHPLIRRELAGWRARAAGIQDAGLRELALQALQKRMNMEGAAAFATFVPRERRRAVVRATVAFQAAYNHLDLLSEQPHPGDAVAHAAQLHGALPAMLSDAAHAAGNGDDGYLQEMIDSCRRASAQLPGYPQVAERAVRAAERVARFQAYNCGARQGDQDRLARWASTAHADTAALAWWESAAAAGSSLGVHVMLAAAAKPHQKDDLLHQIEEAYFPWIGALHSILDQLIDRDEDERTGQANLTSHYRLAEQAQRIGWLAEQALARARALDGAVRAENDGPPFHTLILTAMAASYLSSPHARRGPARAAARAVLDQLRPLVAPSIAVFRLTGRAGGGGRRRRSGPASGSRPGS